MYNDVTGTRTGPDYSKVLTECLNINECETNDLNTCGLHGNCIGMVIDSSRSDIIYRSR